MHRYGIAVIVLALTAGFYLLLIDTTDLPELYAMCAIVLLGLIAFTVSKEQFGGKKMPLVAIARSGRVLAKVPMHIALLAYEAFAQAIARRPRRGVMRAVRFDAGAGPEGAGRTALAELAGSFAPNTVVLGVDPDTNLLLVHQLHRQGGREELDVLGIG